MAHYRPPAWTPELEAALEAVQSGKPHAGFTPLLTALSHTTGTNPRWNLISVNSREELFQGGVNLSTLSTLCEKSWDLCRLLLETLPPSPALAALTLHSLPDTTTKCLPQTFAALIQTLNDPSDLLVTLPLHPTHLATLPANLVTALIQTTRATGFFDHSMNRQALFEAWIQHPGVHPVMEQALPLLFEHLIQRHDLFRTLHTPALAPFWPPISQHLKTQPPRQRVALLMSPQATPDDVTQGLQALGWLMNRPLHSFPSCDFTHAAWDQLKPRVLLTALTHLYNCEQSTTHLPVSCPPAPLIDRAFLALSLSSNKKDQSCLEAYQPAAARHDGFMTHGIDAATWLGQQLRERLGATPTQEEVLTWTTELILWMLEEPTTRRTLSADLLSFFHTWQQHPGFARDTPPYTLTHTVHQLRPPFLPIGTSATILPEACHPTSVSCEPVL